MDDLHRHLSVNTRLYLLTLSLLQIVHFIILICLTSDDLIRQGRSSSKERVNWVYLSIVLP